ncbi:tRNA pseudouridine synthase D [Ophiobolus disseminans]|uniref:tRNA pseudouridine synthase D n=1 Tax=Ophiobolus disseminans TaxID=1469910 RepID=A0A6A7A5P1_9PLEO|nr:tRNA pseudouridine synthase D [Ophiobolus disseminans]
MSDHTEDTARPAKRARLDDNVAPTVSAETSAPTPQSAAIAPKATSTTAIDEDLEREVRAGITEYVCPDNLGFTGILKQRYTDFLVNEIGLDGQVLHLRSTEVLNKKSEKQANGRNPEKKAAEAQEPKTFEDKGDSEMVDAQNGENGEQKVPTESVERRAQARTRGRDDRKTLHSIFGEDITNQIIKLVGQIRKREDRKAKDFKAVITPPMSDRELRTQAHQSLRRIFPNILESYMEEDQCLRIKATPPAERKGGGNRGRRAGPRERGNGGSRWEELGGEYLHFTLYKENKDTMEVVGFLGSKLGGGGKAFDFAGTKDRRACTVQRLCVKRQTAERMQSFNKILFNSAIGDWEHSPHKIKLGDLMGNEFTITLRDCHFQGEEGLDLAQRHKLANKIVDTAIKDFSEKGFINYYGLQRFGSFAASTDVIGRKMLQDDLAGAVADLLAYSDVALAAAEGTLPSDSTIQVSQDDRNRAKALHMWHTAGKGAQALDLLPRKFTAERNMIQHLNSRNGRNGQRDRKTDWQGALMTIPRNLRLMYVHAYQSLVWNVVAGKRWSTHGDKVVEGDLVLVNEHADKQATKTVVQPRAIDDNGEIVINPTGSENANAGAQEFERARPLSAEEASSGKYTIWDVVLPQPGFDVEYPKNDIGEFYKEFMSSDKGGGLDPHNMRRGWREVSLSGGYRKFMSRPLEPLSFEVREYVQADAQFVETDLQRMRKAKAEKKEEDAEMEDGEEKEQHVGEKKLAVVIKLQLASSQYATMALRELMKAGGVRAYKPEFMGGR